VARFTFDTLWKYNYSAFPPPELDHLQYDSVVDVKRAQQYLGFKPAYGWPEIIAQIQGT